MTGGLDGADDKGEDSGTAADDDDLRGRAAIDFEPAEAELVVERAEEEEAVDAERVGAEPLLSLGGIKLATGRSSSESLLTSLSGDGLDRLRVGAAGVEELLTCRAVRGAGGVFASSVFAREPTPLTTFDGWTFSVDSAN